jgi:hypothetical protein
MRSYDNLFSCWTVSDIRLRLAKSEGLEKDRLIAWIMRESEFRDVWLFVTPQEVPQMNPE